jgi:hypothetical protein
MIVIHTWHVRNVYGYEHKLTRRHPSLKKEQESAKQTPYRAYDAFREFDIHVIRIPCSHDHRYHVHKIRLPNDMIQQGKRTHQSAT